MNIGLNLWIAPTAWWPQGASYVADFAADRYMRDGEAVAAGAAYDLVRSSAKYAADSSGHFGLFGIDVAARTDCGLSVEPASNNILTDPVYLANWTAILASAMPVAGPVLGIFTQPMLVTDTSSAMQARLRHPINAPIVSGASYALSYWFQTDATPTVMVLAGGDGGRSRLVLALDTGTVSGQSQVRGPLALVDLVQQAADIYCAQVLWTPSFSGACEVAMGPGTGAAGDAIIALGAFTEPGTAFTSPMIGAGTASSRAADSVTLHLPPGPHELTFTFEDMTTQVISGAAGDYAVPTDLDGAVIRSVVAMPL